MAPQPFLLPEDLLSRIYQNNLDEITRDDSELAERAILVAVTEMKMYLTRYDTAALLGEDGEPPTYRDPYLQQLAIQIAVWYLVLLGNPGVDFTTARNGYEAALSALRDIQAFRMQPIGWPYRDTSSITAPDGSAVSASYTHKRNNDF